MDLSNAEFTVAAQHLHQMPADTGAEVAFAGRSNAGKSSALNTLTNRRGLARVSKTPGRTQQLVVFEIDAYRRLVDLPGYGYAKVPPRMQEMWRQTLEDYFSERRSLKGLVQIMDVRHPMREYDVQMLEYCMARELPVHVLLTKSDKLKRGAAMNTLLAVRKDFGHVASVQLFSSLNRTGEDEARERIREWLDQGLPEGEGS